MDITAHEPQAFAEIAGSWLARDPFSTNVIGVHLLNVSTGRFPANPGDLWLTVTGDMEVLGVAMHTPPFPVFLPRLRSGLPEVMANWMADHDRLVSGVTGESSSVDEFARTWCGRTHAKAETFRSNRIYRLSELRPPDVDGSPRRAQADDLQLVISWLQAFEEEVLTTETPGGSASRAPSRIGAGEVWLWCVEGVPVSMAGHSPPAAGVSRVGPVYTPPDERRRGYGAAISAQVTQAALEAGAQQVMLYADRDNPTSNSVYQRIGYVADHDGEERLFRKVAI